MAISVASPRTLAELLKQGRRIALIDVRTPIEFVEAHVDQARNVPLDQLDPAAIMEARNATPDDPVFVICRSGGRAQKACQKFLDAGFTNVVNVEGGTLACIEAGLPIVRGKKVISLERQIRIAAGFLVLTGVLLGLFVNPWFVAISAFVGAGLLFAGVTDKCGMGLILARMPWNRCGQAQSTSCFTQ